MAFLEDVGADLDAIAHLALDGIAAAVHDGGDVLDDDGAPEVLGVEHGDDLILPPVFHEIGLLSLEGRAHGFEVRLGRGRPRRAGGQHERGRAAQVERA